MSRRKYEVTGEDDLSDIHSFYTDDRQRAEQVAELMRDDLEEVQVLEHS
jgi:hypothetical protein